MNSGPTGKMDHNMRRGFLFFHSVSQGRCCHPVTRRHTLLFPICRIIAAVCKKTVWFFLSFKIRPAISVVIIIGLPWR